jgi:gliding motility-associated-like protein
MLIYFINLTLFKDFMRLKYYYIACFLLFSFSFMDKVKCQKADFKMDKVQGCDSLLVTFFNTSTPDGGESVTDYNYYWSFDNSRKHDTASVRHLFVNNLNDTIIYITLTMRHKDIEGKEASKRDSIRLRPLPNAWFQIVDHPLDTLLYTFRSGRAYSDTIKYRYIWRDVTANKILAIHPDANALEGSGKNKIKRDTLIHLFSSNQVGYRTIELKVSDWFGCSAHFDTTILISPKLVVPKFFTPNGDGQNDYFYVQTNGKDRYKLEIFNSRGQRIFHSSSQSIMWDGILENSGQPAPPGTYYYYIESLSGVPAVAKGFFVLFRN